MHMLRPVRSLPPRMQALPVTLLLSILLLLVSACGGNTPIQQQASQKQGTLANLLHQAQTIGVPGSLLQPVIAQEQQLTSTQAPFNLFDNQPATDYYRNIGTRYTQLVIQTQGIIALATEQKQTQAQQDVQKFAQSLAPLHTQEPPVNYFMQQHNQLQDLLATARYPKDYTAVSTKADVLAQAVSSMNAANHQLQTFKNAINQMQTARLDTTVLQMQYQNDQQLFANANATPAFQNLGTLINAQYLQMIVSTQLALPYVINAQLSNLAGKIEFLKTGGVNTATYQQYFNTAKAAASKVENVQQYIQFSKQVNTDLALMNGDILAQQAKALLAQFHKQADAWSNAHLYHDKYDGNTYSLDAAYQLSGIGSWLDDQLAASITAQDYQDTLNTVNDELFNLHTLETDYNDKTPYNQVHASDTQLLNHYNLQKGQIIVVSTVAQTLRLYQDGKLVKAFYVTTGRAALPSLPGQWNVQERLSPTVFKSIDPPGSPYWYPDTPIHYAMLYHSGGYFIHDSWWRADYGPNTQFPHYDSGGDQSFSGTGSHGCINMQEAQAAWLYNNTSLNTQIIIY